MYEWDVVGLVEVARKAAGADVSMLDDGSLTAAAGGIAEAISVLEDALAHVMAELDGRGVCERETGLSTGSWLARETGLPKARAQWPVKVGRCLRALPMIDAAVADGRLTIAHAVHLARKVNPRVIDAVAVVQDQIIEWAAGCGFELWARQVSALVELLDQDGPEPDDEPVSKLTLAPTTDGITYLKGQLAGADGVLVRQTMEGKADELFHRYKHDHDETGGAVEVPPRSVLLALAMVEICRLANARDIGSSKPARPDVTLIVRAGHPLDDDAEVEPESESESAGDDADADEVAERNGTGEVPDNDESDEAESDNDESDEAESDDVASDDGEAPIATPVADVRRFASGDRAELDRLAGLVLHGDTRPSHIPVPLFGPTWPEVTDLTGVRLQDATTRVLLCDPDLHALIVDGLGVPLDLGRTARFANDDQRRALLVRDGGCIFPGCDRPPGWCDAHHVHPYDDGGPTDLAWLALLCRRHHGISHRRGWTMHATDDHWYWWTAPNGQTFWSQRHGHRRSGPTPA